MFLPGYEVNKESSRILKTSFEDFVNYVKMKLIPPQNSGKQKKSEIGAHNPTAKQQEDKQTKDVNGRWRTLTCALTQTRTVATDRHEFILVG
jgi:hypothetical protein